MRETLARSTTGDASRFRNSTEANFTGNVTGHTVITLKSLGYVKKKFRNSRYFLADNTFFAWTADLFLTPALGTF